MDKPFTAEPKRPWRPDWVSVALGVSAVSAALTLVLLSVAVAKIVPAARDLTDGSSELFDSLEPSEVNVAIRRLINLLDDVCSSYDCGDEIS